MWLCQVNTMEQQMSLIDLRERDLRGELCVKNLPQPQAQQIRLSLEKINSLPFLFPLLNHYLSPLQIPASWDSNRQISVGSKRKRESCTEQPKRAVKMKKEPSMQGMEGKQNPALFHSEGFAHRLPDAQSEGAQLLANGAFFSEQQGQLLNNHVKLESFGANCSECQQTPTKDELEVRISIQNEIVNSMFMSYMENALLPVYALDSPLDGLDLI